MADENNEDLGSEIITTETPAPTHEKKKRGPGRVKTAVEPAVSTSESAPASPNAVETVRRGAGRKAKPVDAKIAATKVKPAVKATRLKRAEKLVEQPVAEASVITARDEMDDLIQLEAENKQLRQALGEKLRQENADLRKRLG
jgi:putative transposase